MLCRDGHGGVRIEIGCGKNATGECFTSCGEETDEHQDEQHPCDDTPIKFEGGVAKVSLRMTLDTSVTAQLPCALPTFFLEAPASSPVRWTWTTPDRPPDMLRHVRSVVILI